MTFLSAAAFFLLPLLPAIVLFYMLKLKRRREVVPSTLLWRRSVQDLIANSPFQKLKNNLLMYLQLLILAALILALARPVMRLKREGGTTVVLLMDQTASMKAVEPGGKTRMDLAREAALRAIEQLGSNDEAIVVGFSNRTQIIQTLTGDRGLLRAAVEGIGASDSEVNLSETSLILEGLTTSVNSEAVRTPRDNTRTIVFSDGGLGDVSEKLASVPNLEYVAIGTQGGNLGIIGVDLRESFAGDFEQQVFASIWNSAAEERTAQLELRIGGETVDVKETPVPARGFASVVFTLTGERTGPGEITLPSGGDPFPVDDVARFVIPPPSRLNILVVSKGNFFLEQALNVDPRVQVSRVLPTDYEALSGNFDLTVFDNCTAGQLGSGMFVFMNALPPATAIKETGTLNNPSIVDWNRVHPLMRYVNLDRVLVGEAKKLEVPPDMLALVESGETPLMVWSESETRQILVLAFDIFKSYWPVDVSFPIFMANLVDVARRSGRGAQRPSYASGATIPIVAPKDSTSVSVKTPSGNDLKFELAGASTAYLTETNEAGFYEVSFPAGEKRTLAVNLFSERESDIEPVPSITAGSRVISAQAEAGRTRREIWHWLAAAAFAILALEWYIYCRRAWM